MYEKLPKNLLQIIHEGENYRVEFKEAKDALPKSLFETVCAMLNRNGGHIFLGVKNDKVISGVSEKSIIKIKKEFSDACNNMQKINPTICLTLKSYNYNGKTILYTYIPQSSTVHRTSGKIFDRNEDGDYEIKSESLVESIYLRKQTDYSENTIYPYITMDDLRSDLIDRFKEMVILNKKTDEKTNKHWLTMTNEEILKSMRLIDVDYKTGKEGITLAAILLFGKDEVIKSVVPHHRTDAIKRVYDVDRYDDRDLIITNLIESYDRLMDFIDKHLDDRFYLEDNRRINIRDVIAREVIVNFLIHREYLEPFYSRLIITKDLLITENANKARMVGDIVNEKNFSPKPKNPKIALAFREMGLADELGSGLNKLLKYVKVYSNGIPKLIEGDIFRTEIPINYYEEIFENNIYLKLNNAQKEILKNIQENKYITKEQLATKTGLTIQGIKYNIRKLKDKNMLIRVGNGKNGYWEIITKS